MEPTQPYEIKDIAQLKPNPKNPRRISKEDFAALQVSIQKFGDLSCVVFNVRTQQLVGGHQRLEAIKTMNPPARIMITQRLDHIDEKGTVAEGTIYVGNDTYKYREVDWDEGTEKAANIAANRIQGEFDLELLAQMDYELAQLDNGAELLAATGQGADELSKLLDSVGAMGEGDPADDEAPALDEQNPPVSRLGEIYQLGVHRLMCGDSTDFGAVSDLMNGNTADLVFTDPPYGVDFQSNRRVASEQFSKLENDDKIITEWIEPMLAVSRGFTFIWTTWKVLTQWLEATTPIGPMTNMIIWDKGGGGIGDLTGTYSTDYEIALVFNRGAKLTGDRFGSVWGLNRESGSVYEHPTQKPTSLAEQAIRTTTLRNNIILDLFGGSGSTLIAADKTGRICYLMELDPKYCDVIRKRYAKHIGQEENWQAATPIIQAAPEETNAAETPSGDLAQPAA